MSNAIILGDRSEIASAISVLLKADGWIVDGWHRGEFETPAERWDLVLIALGAVAPVGNWWELRHNEVSMCMHSNLMLPLNLLREIWPSRNQGAYVCWLAGSNPNEIMDGYSAYNISKMAVLKAVEQLDHESPDATFFALGPGTIVTKIHKATIEAQWPNPKLKAAIDSEKEGDFDRKIAKVYDCMKWCMSLPKHVIGGRNICVSDPWDEPKEDLDHFLSHFPDLYKLRRREDETS